MHYPREFVFVPFLLGCVMTLWITRVNIGNTTFTRVQGTVIMIFPDMPAALSHDGLAVLYAEHLDNNNYTRVRVIYKDHKECNRWHCDYAVGDTVEVPTCRTVSNKREIIEEFDCPIVKVFYFAWWAVSIPVAGLFLVFGWLNYHP
jgi:hypothetical protein